MARILVVDDEPSIRTVFQVYLEGEGHTVTVAINADMALSILAHTAVDLLITDIFMPGKDGLALIRTVRQDFPGVKIIAVSGGNRCFGVNTLEIAKQLGAAVALEKPLNIFALGAAVEQLAGRQVGDLESAVGSTS
jgi:CheY-like chemotaxis protein